MNLVKLYYILLQVVETQNMSQVCKATIMFKMFFMIHFKKFFQVSIMSTLSIMSTKNIVCDVIELLDNGVYYDPRDRRGSTPLFQASVQNDYKIVNFLINSGAEIFKRRS
eukprot:365515_1